MLSYRHAFHAGNHADILKHATLSLLFASFRQKDKPFIYIDTHAGAGAYDLKSDWAHTTGEAKQGILRLWPQRKSFPELSDYFQAIAALNAEDELRYYTGSAELARQLTRTQDKLHLMELHPKEIELLQQQIGREKNIIMQQRDGLDALTAILPPPIRRGLVLIDPPYEQVSEYQAVPKAIAKALPRWATGTYVVWYPLLARSRDHSAALLAALQQLPVKNLLVAELAIEDQAPEFGMHGSGMAILNAPWQLAEQLQALLPKLLERLKQNEYAGWKVEWRIQGD